MRVREAGSLDACDRRTGAQCNTARKSFTSRNYLAARIAMSTRNHPRQFQIGMVLGTHRPNRCMSPLPPSFSRVPDFCASPWIIYIRVCKINQESVAKTDAAIEVFSKMPEKDRERHLLCSAHVARIRAGSKLLNDVVCGGILPPAGYDAKTELEKCLAAGTEAVKLEPNSFNARMQRSMLLETITVAMKAFTPERAQMLVDDSTALISLKKAENRIYCWMSRANAYFALGEFQKAVQDWDVVVKTKPTHCLFKLQRGIALYKTQSFDQAIRDFTQVTPYSSHRCMFILVYSLVGM